VSVLYVVSGLNAAHLVPQFWALAGRLFTVAEGRRSCAFRPRLDRSGRSRPGRAEPALVGACAHRRHVSALGLEDWFDELEDHFDAIRAALGVYATERERLLDLLAEREGGLVLT
jgi:hypothetical protein